MGFAFWLQQWTLNPTVESYILISNATTGVPLQKAIFTDWHRGFGATATALNVEEITEMGEDLGQKLINEGKAASSGMVSLTTEDVCSDGACGAAK